MSKDIRSYFILAGSKKKAEENKKDEVVRKSKKKVAVLVSDSDDEDPNPPLKKKKQQSEDAKQSSKSPRTKTGKDPPQPKLKPVDVTAVFGTEPTKRTTKPEKTSSKKQALELLPKQEKESHSDDDFAATLDQLDSRNGDRSKREKRPTPKKQTKETEQKKTPRKEVPEKALVTPEKSPFKTERDTGSSKKENEGPASVQQTPSPRMQTTPKSTPRTPVDPEEKKQAFLKYLHREGPRHPGSKEIPEGTPTCLKGLVFVITGVLDSLDREEATELVKRCGGRVTSSISRNTSYLVVGDDAGQSKLDKAEKCRTKQIDEDGLLDLIRSRSSEGKTEVQKTPKKEAIKLPVKVTSSQERGTKRKANEVEEKAASDGSKKKPKQVTSPSLKHDSQSSTSPHSSDSGFFSGDSQADDSGSVSSVVRDSKLFVDKYKPTSSKQIIGQQGDRSNVRKLTKWLQNWHKNHCGAKKLAKPSPWAKDDDGAYFKAALLSGSPGVGKTTTAHIIAKELGFDIVEFNASDTRSKRLLHEEVTELLSTKTLAGYFFGSGKASEHHVLIMDEVDGMAGNEDRGGMQELIQLIKTSRIPIMCICNDRNHPKVRSLANYCYDLRFQKPRVEQVKAAMMSLCFKEGIKIKPEALSEMIVASNQDIRQVLHHLALWSADEKSLSTEHVKKDAMKSKKDYKLGPWDVLKKVFSAEEHKSMSIYDKSDLFFHDYSIAPLFVQENYLIVNPHAARNDPKKALELVAAAADSISHGDLVDRAIRSTNSWSLLPVQAIFSSVIPGDIMEGHLTGMINFPSWLGKNSKRGKMNRLLQELQLHMRLRISGSKEAVNLEYVPALRDAVLRPLQTKGAEGGHEALQILQHYQLLREDLDSLVELGQWPGKKDPYAQIDSKVKAAFTRLYNKEGVATPYAVHTVAKKRNASQADDMYGEDEEEEIEEEEEDDLESDAMIKMKKPAGRGRAKDAGPSTSGETSGKGKGSRGGGRGGGRGRGRGKKE